MASVRIKVERLDLIASLQAAIARSAANVVANKRLKEAYDKAYNAWLVKTVKSLKLSDAIRVVFSEGGSYRAPEVEFAFPIGYKLPKFDGDYDLLPVLHEWDVKEIESVIKMLNLSTEKTISTSTLGNVAKFL